jgi:hypothetical protein
MLLYTVAGKINVRRIITSAVFIASNYENILEISSASSWCEQFMTSTSYQGHLETVEVCLSRVQELE